VSSKQEPPKPIKTRSLFFAPVLFAPQSARSRVNLDTQGLPQCHNLVVVNLCIVAFSKLKVYHAVSTVTLLVFCCHLISLVVVNSKKTVN
jgi:hypothetical protein